MSLIKIAEEPKLDERTHTAVWAGRAGMKQNYPKCQCIDLYEASLSFASVDGGIRG